MRIGLDYRPVTAAPSSGIARQVLALEQVLAALPADELVRFTGAPEGHGHRADTCCPEQPMPREGLHRPRQRWRFEVRFLPRALREQRIDVYIATANSGLPLRRPATLHRQVLMLHDLFQLSLPGRHASVLRSLVYRGMDRLAIGHAVRAADVIWTPSRHTAGELARLFPGMAGKARVLPNAVFPLSPPADERDSGIPSRYWLLVGSREPRKNLPLFLTAWHAARTADAAVPELVVVGAPADVPAAMAAWSGIHWRSGLSDAALSRLYHDAERLCHPAYAEGFGLPVVEAMGCGTPVVVARGSALDEIVPAGTPRFDPHDAEDIARTLRRLAGCARGEGERPDALRAFAAGFGREAYAARVHVLVEELRR